MAHVAVGRVSCTADVGSVEVASELRRAGAERVDAHLGEDGGLITAGEVADLSGFTKALLAHLER